MATSAFKSTTKRTPIGSSPPSTTADSSSSSYSNRATSGHRRSRSLSRFSRPLPDGERNGPHTRGRFVNTDRGSGFPDVALDDLAVSFFGSARSDRGRLASRNDEVSDGRKFGSSQRRGRSVSRHGSFGKESNGNSDKGARVYSETNNSRRRRSVSVVRYQMSDSESDLDHPQKLHNYATLRNLTDGNRQIPSSDKTECSNPRLGLRRSHSQKDLKHQDDYSSQSSVLTDDEGRDAHSIRNGAERTIRAVYAQKKVDTNFHVDHPISDDVNCGLYEAMRKELRHAVDEIRMELEQATMGKRFTSGFASDKFSEPRNSDVIRSVSTIRKSYATKLEESEKRKHDLLAEIVLEEQRGKELSKIVKELLPDPQNTVTEKPLRTRKRSNDRSRMSKRLTEEAEKYIEDFLSNIEDTDISSLDGERSETSSTLGGTTFQSPPISTKSLPVEMEGLVLPWLQWETANDASPSAGSIKMESMATPKTNLWHAVQEASPAGDLSSHGSWSPGVLDGQSTNVGEITGIRHGELGNSNGQFMSDRAKSLFDAEEYINRPSEEDFIFERWRQGKRVQSGGLLLCNQMFL